MTNIKEMFEAVYAVRKENPVYGDHDEVCRLCRQDILITLIDLLGTADVSLYYKGQNVGGELSIKALEELLDEEVRLEEVEHEESRQRVLDLLNEHLERENKPLKVIK